MYRSNFYSNLILYLLYFIKEGDCIISSSYFLNNEIKLSYILGSYKHLIFINDKIGVDMLHNLCKNHSRLLYFCDIISNDTGNIIDIENLIELSKMYLNLYVYINYTNYPTYIPIYHDNIFYITEEMNKDDITDIISLIRYFRNKCRCGGIRILTNTPESLIQVIKCRLLLDPFELSGLVGISIAKLKKGYIRLIFYSHDADINILLKYLVPYSKL